MKTDASEAVVGISPLIILTVYSRLSPASRVLQLDDDLLEFLTFQNGKIGVWRIGLKAVISLAPEWNECRSLHVPSKPLWAICEEKCRRSHVSQRQFVRGVIEFHSLRCLDKQKISSFRFGSRAAVARTMFRLNHHIGPTADYEKMLDIVAADEYYTSASADRDGIDYSNPAAADVRARRRHATI